VPKNTLVSRLYPVGIQNRGYLRNSTPRGIVPRTLLLFYKREGGVVANPVQKKEGTFLYGVYAGDCKSQEFCIANHRSFLFICGVVGEQSISFPLFRKDSRCSIERI